MKHALKALGSVLLLGACRMLVPHDKRPPFSGAIREAVWTVDGISAESVAANAEIVLVIGTSQRDSSKRLFAFDAANGRQLWASSFSPERIVVLGHKTGFVIEALEKPAPTLAEGANARLRMHWLELATGRTLDFSRDWVPAAFVDQTFYGFDEKLNLVAVREQGTNRQQARTALEGPAQLAVTNVSGAEDVLAVLGTVPGGTHRRLLVFQRSTLRSLWAALFPVTQDSSSQMDVNVGGGSVFVREHQIRVEGDISTTHAFEARTGTKRWQRADNGEIRKEDGLLGFDRGVLLMKKPYKGYTIASGLSGMDRSNLGFEPSPFFVNGIDPLTGKDLWIASLYTRGDEGIIASGGLIYTRDKRYYAVIDEAGHATPTSWLTCVDPAADREIWRSRVFEETYLTAPVAAGNLIITGGAPYSPRRGRAIVFALNARR